MEKIRKGNDIEILWAIYSGNGGNVAPYNLEGKNLTLYLKNAFGTKEIYDFTVDRHIIRWVFYGKDQDHLGVYSLVLVENEGKQGMHTVDECGAFSLVKTSCEADNDQEGRVECIHLQLRSSMSVGFPAIGAQMEVDSTLSPVSENPVQNKVITLELQKMEDRLVKKIVDNESRLTLVERSLELVEDSVQSLSIKVDAFEDRLKRVEEGGAEVLLVKVEELTTSVDTLMGDAETEGSVDNKIANALDWNEID